MREIRIALRGLLRAPGLSAVIVVSLSVGLGAATTAFNWVDSFVLRPLPGVERAGEIVSVFTRGPGGAEWSLSYPTFRRWSEGAEGAVDLAVGSFEQLSLRHERFGPERVFGEAISGNYFEVLGVRPVAGRMITPGDEAAAAQVVVLSERLWTRGFDRDPSILDRQVTLNGNGYTVVGIAPAGFGGAMVGLAFDAWVPVTTLPVLKPGYAALTQDGSQFLQAVARSRTGAGLDGIRAAMETVSRRVAADRGEATPTLAGVRALSQSGGGPLLTPLFFTLFGLAVVILLVACANVANLMLARATRRGREMGVRLALGASRLQVVRQLFVESLLLAVGGGLLGLLLAAWARGLLGAVMPAMPFPVRLETDLNGRVLGLVALLTLGTALLVGLLPAFRATRPSLVTSLKDERLPGTGRSWARQGLVVAQVALSLVALVSAGLFYRSLEAARQADIGVGELDRVMVAGTSFELAGTPDSVSRASLVRVVERLRALPGVTAASCVDVLPASIGSERSSSVSIAGYEPGPDENMSLRNVRACPGYFEAMGIGVVRGRGIDDGDGAGGEQVVVVNEAFVTRYWPDREPIGGTITAAGRDRTVVGVARNVILNRVGETPIPVVYYPVAQRFNAEQVLVVRTDGDPRALIEPVRKALAAVDPNLPMLDPRTMRDHLQGALFIQSTGASILSGLGLVALGLATLGLYGVLSFSVSVRSREIGIRMALGSARRGVIGLVVRQAARLLAVGGVIGLALAVALANLLRSQLYGVAPADPVTLVVVLAVLAVVGAVAAVLPARRAAAIDPVVTLKSE